jgi:hypothetical protein
MDCCPKCGGTTGFKYTSSEVSSTEEIREGKWTCKDKGNVISTSNIKTTVGGYYSCLDCGEKYGSLALEKLRSKE